MPQDRYRCTSLLCLAIIATKRDDMIRVVSPARLIAADKARILIVCKCGRKRWIDR